MADKKPGINWGALMKMVAPVVGEIATGGDRGAFTEGFMRAQARAEQKRLEQAEAEQRRKATGAEYLLEIGQHAQGIDDPVDFENFLALAEQAGTSAGYVEPGALRSGVQFNNAKANEKALKDLDAQIKALESGPNPYDLDELETAGVTLKLPGGKTIPLASARQMVRARVEDPSGQPVPRPKKAEATPSLQAREVFHNGKTIYANYNPKTGKYTDDTGAVLTGVAPKPEKGPAAKEPMDPLDRRLKELQVAAEEAKLNDRAAPPKPSHYAIDAAQRTITAIDEVLPKISNMTAGVGSLLSKIPGSSAANVSAELSSVAANVAFQALQAMREASKTGGALGQVSERELDLLSAVEGSIRQNQSPDNLRKNLLLIKASMQRFMAAAGGVLPMASHGGASPSGGLVPMTAPDGRSLMVPSDKVRDLEAKGARRK